LNIKRADYTNLSIRQDTLIQEERKPISKSAMMILNCFWVIHLPDTRLHQNGILTNTPLTPKHRINSVLMYEVEDKWKVGLEAYYFSPQKLSDGATGKQYVLCGFMVEKLWEKFSVYINFENFLDARQTRFDTIYTGTVTNPVFRDIYAPLDGFLINGGIKLKL
jgi:outer membrane receptor for ferrienterochelin and colicins